MININETTILLIINFSTSSKPFLYFSCIIDRQKDLNSSSILSSILRTSRNIVYQNKQKNIPKYNRLVRSTGTDSSVLSLNISMVAPPWLESLLSTTFFHICEVHREVARNECNMFCLDCHSNAFCYCCISSRHKNHQVIQIRRSSYHDVVRASEIQRVLDISGVQTYVINSARVLFLNERPQPRIGKSVGHMCEICGRSLLDPFRFCSLGCKLVGVKRNGNASFTIEGKDEEQGLSSISTMRSNSSNRKDKEREELHESSQQAISSTMFDSPSHSRRRKGIPHRAPFKS